MYGRIAPFAHSWHVPSEAVPKPAGHGGGGACGGGVDGGGDGGSGGLIRTYALRPASVWLERSPPLK